MVLDRRVLLALVPGVVVVALDWAGVFGKLPIFVLAAAALIPLAWLIGEATDNAAFHTGPGIGGFLNASFGNAPELIIALVAVSDGLTDVVRASLVGSVVGNLLLVLGFTLLLGQRGSIDRRSAVISLGLAGLATLVIFLVVRPWLPRRSRPPIAGRARAAGRRRDAAGTDLGEPVRAAPPARAVRGGRPDGRGRLAAPRRDRGARHSRPS